MKLKLHILLLLFILSTTGFSQEEKPKLKWATDLGMTYSVIGISQRVELQLAALASIKQHQFRLSPIVHLWSSEASNNPKRVQFSGVALGYFYNIPTVNRFFEMYFKYEMAFQLYRNDWTGTYYNPTSMVYEPYAETSNEFFWGNLFAYGCTAHISKRIFLRADTGLGLYVSKINGENSEFYGLSNAQYDFRGYKDVGAFLKISGAVGYKFGR